MAKPVRILSIDGGGIRGIIPAMILAELERLTQKPISSLFDLIAGTSTGGILALGLTMPDDQGQPAYSASQMISLYEKEGSRIFDSSWWHSLNSLGNFTGPKYPAESIEKVLKEYFKEAYLGDSLTTVLITAYEIERRLAWFFKSRHAKVAADRNFLMWEVARATSAAPTYFPPVKIKAHEGNDYYSFVDGGVFANNPGMCALVEAQKMFPEAEEIVLVSVGTGFSTARLTYDRAKDWGLASWAQPVLNVVFDGIDDTVDYQLGKILSQQGEQKHYYRFQTRLDGNNEALDDSSSKNLRLLRLLAEDLIRDNLDDLRVLEEKLVAE
jgi:patatin-like phospholipase/acyl hydrolase